MSRPLSTYDVYKALSDATRRHILSLLNEGNLSAAEIFEQVSVSQSACSQHLKILRDVGLVTQVQQSRTRIYKLTPEPLEEVRQWTSQFDIFVNDRMNLLEQEMDMDD